VLRVRFVTLQEDYIKDEIKNLKRETIRAKQVRGLCLLGNGVALAFRLPRRLCP